MLTYIQDLKWVGGLALEDADVLAKYGSQSDTVLEFGVGGSTMIFAQTCKQSVTSVDTDSRWIAAVKQRMELIETKKPVEYMHVDNVPLLLASNTLFDILFIDGLSRRRQELALKLWPLLKPGGYLMFHDTRKQQDLLLMQDVICQRLPEIAGVEYNIHASNGEISNVSAVKKRDVPFLMTRHQYIDLQSKEEPRDMWTFGRIEDYDISKGLYSYKAK